MSDIRTIATYINTLLTQKGDASASPVVIAGQFAGKPFQQGLFNGVAELIKKSSDESENEYTVPIIPNANGDGGTRVGINDKYPFQLYHRITDQTQAEAENDDTFGDGNDKSIIFEMAIIIFNDRFNNQLQSEDIITALMLDIPRTINATQITGSQFSKCEINFTETNTNTNDVLNQEFGQDDFEIKQSYFALSFGYEVKLSYTKECFSLC